MCKSSRNLKSKTRYLLNNLPIRGWSDLIDKRNQIPLFLQLLLLKIRSSEQPKNEKYKYLIIIIIFFSGTGV
jgi:hypothetical protein